MCHPLSQHWLTIYRKANLVEHFDPQISRDALTNGKQTLLTEQWKVSPCRLQRASWWRLESRDSRAQRYGADIWSPSQVQSKSAASQLSTRLLRPKVLILPNKSCNLTVQTLKSKIVTLIQKLRGSQSWCVESDEKIQEGGHLQQFYFHWSS